MYHITTNYLYLKPTYKNVTLTVNVLKDGVREMQNYCYIFTIVDGSFHCRRQTRQLHTRQCVIVQGSQSSLPHFVFVSHWILNNI